MDRGGVSWSPVSTQNSLCKHSCDVMQPQESRASMCAREEFFFDRRRAPVAQTKIHTVRSQTHCGRIAAHKHSHTLHVCAANEDVLID